MRSILVLVALVPALAHSAGLPAFLTLPPGLEVNKTGVAEEEWGEALFRDNKGKEAIQRGRHWRASLEFKGVDAKTGGQEVWDRIKPALIQGGWTVVHESRIYPHRASLRLQKGERESWAEFRNSGPTWVNLELIEVGPQPLKFSLPSPGAKPEKIADQEGDFPYLLPLPGSTPGAKGRYDGNFTVIVEDDKRREERQLVGNSHLGRYYKKKGLSTVQFVTIYREALEKAGWKVVRVRQSPNMADGTIYANYAKDGRNIWAYLRHAGDEFSFKVADVGAQDLAAQLAKDCRVPLYGVFFDFDKSTLKPESDPVLSAARDALKANPKLAIEVQGHTDNSGADAYNLTLSDARAKAVMEWLVKNGIAATQLSAKGYGETQPVAENGTDDGRAKNRRVELSCRK